MVIVRISPGVFAGKAYFAVRSRSTYLAIRNELALCPTWLNLVNKQRCGAKYV